MNKWLIFILFLAITCICGSAYSQDASLSREIWQGTFRQSGLVSWQGQMELYIRYDEEAEYPQEVTGMITWIDLGNVRTRIRGKRDASRLVFVEESCLADNCGGIVLGGKYAGTYQNQQNSLTGQAQHQGIGLMGSFNLDRQRPTN